jgi:hypothetical protein
MKKIYNQKDHVVNIIIIAKDNKGNDVEQIKPVSPGATVTVAKLKDSKGLVVIPDKKEDKKKDSGEHSKKDDKTSDENKEKKNKENK